MKVSVIVFSAFLSFGLTGCANPGDQLSTDADLAALSLSLATISPTFSADTLDYTASVANNVTSVTVNAVPADSHASITSGVGTVNIAVGSNTLNVIVTAQSGAIKTYSISVTRAALLRNLTLYISHGRYLLGGTQYENGTVLAFADGTTVSFSPVLDDSWYIETVLGAAYNPATFKYEVLMDADKTVTTTVQDTPP